MITVSALNDFVLTMNRFAIVCCSDVTQPKKPAAKTRTKNVLRIVITIAGNVEAFVFVAEFEIRQLGTNADVKYKSSMLIILLNL